MVSCLPLPAVKFSRSLMYEEQLRRTLLNTLYAPKKDRRAVTVFGGSAVDNGEILWAPTVIVPFLQSHPSIKARVGVIIVFEAFNFRPFFCQSNLQISLVMYSLLHKGHLLFLPRILVEYRFPTLRITFLPMFRKHQVSHSPGPNTLEDL